MINFAIAGKSKYFEVCREYLIEQGYPPKIGIEGNKRIINFKEEINKNNLELLVCVSHPFILKKEEIDLFPKGCINLHSGIPNYCGRHPLNWMLIEGVKSIPIAVHYMNEDIDAGDIIIEDSFDVEREEDYNTALNKILACGKKMIYHAVKQIESGSVYRKKQIFTRQYQKRRVPEDSLIDWGKSSEELHNFIRSQVDSMPNAFAYLENGKRIKFKKSEVGKTIGEILGKVRDKTYVISTKRGVLLVRTDEDLLVGENFKIK